MERHFGALIKFEPWMMRPPSNPLNMNNQSAKYRKLLKYVLAHTRGQWNTVWNDQIRAFLDTPMKKLNGKPNIIHLRPDAQIGIQLLINDFAYKHMGDEVPIDASARDRHKQEVREKLRLELLQIEKEDRERVEMIEAKRQTALRLAREYKNRLARESEPAVDHAERRKLQDQWDKNYQEFMARDAEAEVWRNRYKGSKWATAFEDAVDMREQNFAASDRAAEAAYKASRVHRDFQPTKRKTSKPSKKSHGTGMVKAHRHKNVFKQKPRRPSKSVNLQSILHKRKYGKMSGSSYRNDVRRHLMRTHGDAVANAVRPSLDAMDISEPADTRRHLVNTLALNTVAGKRSREDFPSHLQQNFNAMVEYRDNNGYNWNDIDKSLDEQAIKRMKWT